MFRVYRYSYYLHGWELVAVFHSLVEAVRFAHHGMAEFDHWIKIECEG